MASIIKPPKPIKWEDLADEERTAVEREFKELDDNGNGFVEKSEVKTILEKRSGLKVSDSLVQNFFDNFDQNADGKVTWEEYKSQWVKVLNDQLLLLMTNNTKTWDDFTPQQQANLQACFKTVDEDGSGFIEPHEFKKFIEGLYGQTFSDEEAAQLMKSYDSNNDGKVSFDEFKDAALREINDISKFYKENIFETQQPKQISWDDLNQDQKAFYEKIFKEYDADNNGYIDAAEIRVFIEKSTGLRASEAEVQAFMQQADLNNDNKVSWDEFKHEMLRVVNAVETLVRSKPNKTWDDLTSDQQANLKQTFKLMDQDGNGTIDKDELRKDMQFWAGRTIANDELDAIFKEYDTNNDGKITWDEFVAQSLKEINRFIEQAQQDAGSSSALI